MKFRFLFFLVFAAIRLAGPLELVAQAAAQTLPADVSEPALELRGIINDGNGPRFFLYDTKSATSRWLRLQDMHRGWRVTAYNAPDETITLQTSNRSYTLALGQSKMGATSALPASVRPTVENKSSVASVSNPAALDFSATTVNLSALPIDEQQRLNELAAEVRRRQVARGASGNPTNP